MRRVILSSMVCVTLPCSSASSYNAHGYRKEFIEHKMRVWFPLQRLSGTFLIIRRLQRDIIINVHRSSHKLPVILATFQQTLLSRQIFEKYSYQIS
jgi:hypothetical protein